MGRQSRAILVRQLPRAIVATFAVVGAPVVVVVALSATGTVTSTIALMAVSVALSLGVSYLGAAFWATRKGSGDILFGDLMLWGWLRRWRLERQLTSAVSLLGLREPTASKPVELSASRRVRLLKQLAAGLEARYPDTHGHSRRVARHAATIAKKMGLDRDEVARIRTAATVHDIGKVDLPSAIINKPGALTDEEFGVVKKHPEIGAEMVAGLGDEELARIVRHHHERLDGAGYPDGLSGTQIPLGARIIAVADTFDAITSTRPYRPAMRHKDGLAVLAAEAGTQLDKEAVRAFRRYYSGYRPVALWALLLNGPRQLLVSLASEVKTGGAVAAAALATVGVGDVAIHASHGDGRPPVSSASAATSLLEGAEPGAAGSGPGSSAPGAGEPRADVGRGGTLVANTPGGEGSAGADNSPSMDGSGAAPGNDSADSALPSNQGDDPDPTPGGDGDSSDDNSGDPGSSGGGSSRDSSSGGNSVNVTTSTSDVVSTVTEPVNSTVTTVTKTVEATVPVKVTVPEVDVGSVLPKILPVKLPGK